MTISTIPSNAEKHRRRVLSRGGCRRGPQAPGPLPYTPPKGTPVDSPAIAFAVVMAIATVMAMVIAIAMVLAKVMDSNQTV